ncbi:RHS domain-containing protein [uncultured Ottowia sp.]|nr:RHS domain-containing protein [uncultured Ottowia sp.]
MVTDHLGVPVLALNKAGETTWKANYEAFGKARIHPASTAQINLKLPE